MKKLSSITIKSIPIVYKTVTINSFDTDHLYNSCIKHLVNRYDTYNFSIVSGLNFNVLYGGLTIAGRTG